MMNVRMCSRNMISRQKFLELKKHPKGGAYGCFDSHIKVITKAYLAGAERALIFEDDLVGTSSLTPHNLDKCIRFMKSKASFDIFYLGVIPDIRKKQSKTNWSGIYNVKGLCTHAYVINRQCMEKLIGLKYKGVAIDNYYSNNFKKCYAIYPNMFTQSNSTSDISEMDKLPIMNILITQYGYYCGYPLFLLIPFIIFLLAWYFIGYKYYPFILFTPLLLLMLMVIIFSE